MLWGREDLLLFVEIGHLSTEECVGRARVGKSPVGIALAMPGATNSDPFMPAWVIGSLYLSCILIIRA